MRAGLAALALLALGACATHQPAPPEAPVAQGRPAHLIEPGGLGPVDVGMTIAEANAALGAILVGDEPLDDAELCQTWHLGRSIEAPIYYMAQHGRITRATVFEGGEAIRTRAGIGIGSTSAEVRAAYPNAIEEPAPYGEPPAHDLIVWEQPDARGMRFEIGDDGRVALMHAGDPSILLIEGCA